MTARRPTGTLTSGAAIVSVALWASTFTVFTIAFRRVDPLAFTGARYLLLVPIAVAWLAHGRRRGDAVPTRGDRRAAALAGVFGYFLLEVLFALGLVRTTAVASAILIATHPIWGVTASALGNHRRPRGRELLGLCVGMAGVVVFLGANGIDGMRAGDLLSLGGAISFGIYGAIVERIGQRVPERQLVPRSMLTGGVLLVLVSIPAMLRQDWSVVLPGDWLAIVYAALGPILLGFLLWAWAMKHRGMARTAPFGYLEPLFAASLAVAVLGDAVTAPQLGGAVLVLAGVVLAASGEVRGAPPDATEDIAATIRP